MKQRAGTPMTQVAFIATRSIEEGGYRMDIKIIFSDEDLYTVQVNGETILECLGEPEVDELTIKEIRNLYKEHYSK